MVPQIRPAYLEFPVLCYQIIIIINRL